MDPVNPEAEKTEVQARRARTILLIVMALFIVAPLVFFWFFGTGAAPRS